MTLAPSVESLLDAASNSSAVTRLEGGGTAAGATPGAAPENPPGGGVRTEPKVPLTVA